MILRNSHLRKGNNMKVKIIAVDNDYPSILGYHEFDSLEKAIDFARYGAKGINPDEGDRLILDFAPYGEPNIDVEIPIYDGYVE